jgi:thiol-disulfide isomerase/thioredoxin
MRFPLVLLPGALVLAALLPGPAAGEDWAGWESALASHELRSLDGANVTVGDLRGDVVVVNFWASWCAPCKKELRVLDEWSRELEGRRARILAVSIDKDSEKAAEFIRKSGFDLAVFHDGTDGLARSLDLPSLPCTIVVGPDGRIADVARDGSLETLHRLEATVRKLTPAGTATPATGSGAAAGARG